VNDAFGLHDLDRARITFRQRRNIGNQLCFVEVAPFFIGEDTVVGEIFLPRLLVAWYDRVEKFLRAANDLFLRYRCRVSAN
jgi:hypothetical protein